MTDYTKSFSKAQSSLNEGLKNYFHKVYAYMSVALAITGCAAFATINIPSVMRIMYNISPYGDITGYSLLGLIIMFAPVIISLYFFSKVMKMSISQARSMLWIYSVLIGMSLSSVLIVYTGASVTRTFLVCASIFAGMSIYGYSTKKDLTSFGAFLSMGVLGLFIALIVNMFLKSSMLDYVLSILGVGIFTGLIAWDTQKIKRMYYSLSSAEGVALEKAALLGAFQLYIDFINLFVFLLRFFGARRSD